MLRISKMQKSCERFELDEMAEEITPAEEFDRISDAMYQYISIDIYATWYVVSRGMTRSDAVSQETPEKITPLSYVLTIAWSHLMPLWDPSCHLYAYVSVDVRRRFGSSILELSRASSDILSGLASHNGGGTKH